MPEEVPWWNGQSGSGVGLGIPRALQRVCPVWTAEVELGASWRSCAILWKGQPGMLAGAKMVQARGVFECFKQEEHFWGG